MKTTHTPGPWTFRDGSLMTWAIVPATGPVVAYIAEIARPDNDGEGFVEADANAALIASAPELLAALMELLEQATGPAAIYGDGCGRDGTKTGLSHQEFNQLRDTRIKAARAAIAKAKGSVS